MRKVEILDVIGDGFVLFIDWDGARVFPIFMSRFEVDSIAMALKGLEGPRPMTFQFMASVMDALGGSVESVCINALEENTFYAKLRLGNRKEVDARPSDAVNLAIRVGAPLFAEEAVIEKVGTDVPIDESKRETYRRKGLEALAEGIEATWMARTRREGLTKYVTDLFSDEET